MLFNSFVFLLLFLPITYTVFWLLRTARSRYVWLTITGYVFYGYWDPRFCLLMAFSTVVSFVAGLGLAKSTSPKIRRLFLVVPITIDLCLLGFFKYANFGLATLCDMFHFVGWEVDRPTLDIILPVGISFYTFHTITYIVDCYRGTIKPTSNLFEFSAYVSLFSQLVAGPIVRFRQIEHDLDSLGTADRTRWLKEGLSFFLIGLTEKVVIADGIAGFVDRSLTDYGSLSTMGAWLVMLGYSFQLYFDFCGYSDMAVGLGYMFGLRIPQNFNSPYKALDPSDFWRRWHISLSTCLRDYLYIPLGGNRKSEWMTCRNLMLTMLIGGLWHGASWTFVVWGAYHGILLVMYRWWARPWNALPAFVRQILMFILVTLGWEFFRATDFGMATSLLTTMFVPVNGLLPENYSTFVGYLLIAGAWGMIGPNAFEMNEGFRWKLRYGYIMAVTFGVCITLMMGGRGSPFLYFQF